MRNPSPPASVRLLARLAAILLPAALAPAQVVQTVNTGTAVQPVGCAC